jgi:hypothetical protein
MPDSDPVLTHELKTLQDDVSTSQRRRRARGEPRPTATTGLTGADAAASGQQADDSAEAQELRQQLRELLDEATGFFDRAEKNIATHPTAAVLGALVVGILIGRLLGRR